jgi:hypothetical protein
MPNDKVSLEAGPGRKVQLKPMTEFRWSVIFIIMK